MAIGLFQYLFTPLSEIVPQHHAAQIRSIKLFRELALGSFKYRPCHVALITDVLRACERTQSLSPIAEVVAEKY